MIELEAVSPAPGGPTVGNGVGGTSVGGTVGATVRAAVVVTVGATVGAAVGAGVGGGVAAPPDGAVFAQIPTFEAIHAPPNQSSPRMSTLCVPAGTGVQYELKCSSPSCWAYAWCWAACHVEPPSTLIARFRPMPVNRRCDPAGAGAGNVIGPGLAALTARRLPFRIVKGVAGEIETLSQCHVFAVQPVQSFSGL
jgi:hypothetical protein